MRFKYYYKTSDNVRHEAEISAPSRDEAFAALRDRGIRPIKVVDESEKRREKREGSEGIGKVWRIAALCAACVAAGAAIVLMQTRSAEATKDAPHGAKRHVIESNVVELRSDGAHAARPRPRRFIPELADTCMVTGCLERASERLLARFAMPGEPLPAELPPMSEALMEDFYESLGREIIVAPGDSAAEAELKGIVARLKEEAEVYLRTGRGLADYIGYLRHRQQMENRYRQEIIRDYSGEEAIGMLRAMGFRPEDVLEM